MGWNSDDWKGIASTIGKIAPALGTLIGGPVGGAIGVGVKIAATALGVEESPEAISSALATDPGASEKIKQALLDNEAEVNRLAYETTQMEMQTNAQIIASLNKADESGHSTRPKIALELARAFLGVYVLIGGAMTWAICSGEMQLSDSWIALTAYLGIPMTVIKMYFGDLRKEHAQEKGQQVDFGPLGNILGKIK